MPIVDGKTLIGWGAVRETPWHFAGLFASQEEAQMKADAMGEGYVARYGERQDEPDTFASADAPLPSAIAGSIFEPGPGVDDSVSRLQAVAAWIDDHLVKARSEP